MELEPNELDEGIRRGLDFLEHNQLPSGEFKICMSTDQSFEKDWVVDSSPFPTALIAYSLGFADSMQAQEMKRKALQFFIAEMEGAGLWRYWTKQHQYHSIIPPDLDDIACISYVMRQHGISFPANEKLILANRNHQRLFYTWITPRWPLPLDRQYWCVALRQWSKPVKQYYFWKLNESAPNDVDCVVNANVLFYLGDTDATRNVVRYLIDVFRAEQEECCDKWHLNRFMFYYAVSRNFHAGVSALAAIRDEAIARIERCAQPDGSIGGTVLDTALAVCSLLYWKNAGRHVQRAIHFLLRVQRHEGAWPGAALYYGGPKKYYGWGSEELTTGFCLEALLHYRIKVEEANAA